VVLRTRGALADHGASDELYAGALSWHDRLGSPLERARTLLSRGRTRIAHGDTAGGHADLAEAATTFRSVGAQSWLAYVETQVSAIATTSPVTEQRGWAAPSPSLASALSTAELRVALAVGSGRSNREVAQQLFVSIKTVDFHLRSIYRKLDLRSRTELALALAAERALLTT